MDWDASRHGGSTEVCRESQVGDVTNGRFEDVPQTEQPERSNRKKDGGGGKGLRQWSVNQSFLQNSDHLGREWGESLAISRSHQPSSAITANIILFTRWACLHEVRHDKIAAHLYRDSHPSSQPSRRTLPSQLPQVSTMQAESQQPKGREGAISALNTAVEASNLAKISSIPPVRAVFGSVVVLLTLIRVCFLLFCNDLPQVHTQLGLDG